MLDPESLDLIFLRVNLGKRLFTIKLPKLISSTFGLCKNYIIVTERRIEITNLENPIDLKQTHIFRNKSWTDGRLAFQISLERPCGNSQMTCIN